MAARKSVKAATKVLARGQRAVAPEDRAEVAVRSPALANDRRLSSASPGLPRWASPFSVLAVSATSSSGRFRLRRWFRWRRPSRPRQTGFGPRRGLGATMWPISCPRSIRRKSAICSPNGCRSGSTASVEFRMLSQATPQIIRNISRECDRRLDGGRHVACTERQIRGGTLSVASIAAASGEESVMAAEAGRWQQPVFSA